MAQWCKPPYLKPQQSGGVGLIPGRTPPLGGHDKGSPTPPLGPYDKGSWTQLSLLYFCDPSARC